MHTTPVVYTPAQLTRHQHTDADNDKSRATYVSMAERKTVVTPVR